ncbi:MAG TPA: DUF3352 domain-containing protein [Trueperaceae bacterium]
MVIKPRSVRSLALAGCLALFAPAFAQLPLAELAPPDTAVAFAFGSGGAPFAELRRDLAQLEWQAAARTLKSLAASSAELEGLSDLLAGPGGAGALDTAFEGSCPALREPLSRLSDGRWLPPMEGLLAIEIDGVMPSLTAVVRLESPPASALEGLRSALAECASVVSSSESSVGTVDLYHLGAGGSLVATVTDDGLIVAATAPSLLLSVLDRAAGTSTGAELLGSFERFERNETYLGVAIRPPAFIRLLELFAGPSETDQALAARARDALLTVRSIAAQWSAADSRMVTEWAIEVDPNGPDRELAQLLLCDTCLASTPFLIPADALAASSSRLPLEASLEYLEGWLALSEDALDLRALLRNELGLDLDRDLFDWLGEEVHAAVLGAVDTDLRTLLYGPGQLFMIPVTSEAEASAALDRIERALGERLPDEAAPEFPVALRKVEYRNFEYDRIQASVNLDLGVGLIGNHLVLAHPSRSIEAVIDTFLGDPGMVSRPLYREAVRSTPEDAQAVWVRQSAAQIEGFAELLRLAAQPLAFGLQVAAVGLEDAGAEEPVPLWPISTAEVEPQTLQVRDPAVMVTGALDEAAGDPYIDGELSDLYRLEGLEAGDEVTAELASNEFDTALSLIDLAEQVVLEYNDDMPDTSRSEIVFTVPEGSELALQVTSFGGVSAGNYQLAVEVERVSIARPEAATPLPTFAEILTVTELPAEALDIVAEHVGTTVGYTVTGGSVLYSRSETSLGH